MICFPPLGTGHTPGVQGWALLQAENLHHGLLDSFTTLTSNSITQGELEETAHTENNGSTPIYHNAHVRLSSFFSASRSFLQFRWLESELPCGQPQQLWVDYLFSKEALGTELQSLNVVFLVSPSPGRKGSRH